MDTDINKTNLTSPQNTPGKTQPAGLFELWNEFGGTLKGVIITAIVCIILIILTLVVKIIIG